MQISPFEIHVNQKAQNLGEKSDPSSKNMVSDDSLAHLKETDDTNSEQIPPDSAALGHLESVRMRLKYGSVVVPHFTDSQEDTDSDLDTFKTVVSDLLNDYKQGQPQFDSTSTKDDRNVSLSSVTPQVSVKREGPSLAADETLSTESKKDPAEILNALTGTNSGTKKVQIPKGINTF